MPDPELTAADRAELRRLVEAAASAVGLDRVSAAQKVRSFFERHGEPDVLLALLDDADRLAALRGEVEPSQSLGESTCECCGADLEVIPGDEPGRFAVVSGSPNRWPVPEATATADLEAAARRIAPATNREAAFWTFGYYTEGDTLSDTTMHGHACNLAELRAVIDEAEERGAERERQRVAEAVGPLFDKLIEAREGRKRDERYVYVLHIDEHELDRMIAALEPLVGERG